MTSKTHLENQTMNESKKSLALTTSEAQSAQQSRLPIWIKAPNIGLEFYTGLSRAKLYELAGDGLIESRSLRKPGQLKGARLFNLNSILIHINNSPRG